MNYEEFIKQAEFHYNAHENSQTIECATKAIDHEPSKVDGYYWRGLAYGIIGEKEKQRKDADTLLDCTPTSVLHLAYRGWAYSIKKEYEKAIAECEKALTQNDSVKEVYLYRGWAYDDKTDYDRAIEDCNKAIELDPKYVPAYNLRGNVYSNKKNHDRAIEDYNKAIELDPKYATAYNNRGVAYKDKGNLGRAIEDYNKAIELEPKYVTAYNNRINAYQMRLKRVRNTNAEYMDMLKSSIRTVVPFLGAGASIPYGYVSWKDLLLKLLNICCRVKEKISTEDCEKIKNYIESGRYVQAATEMDKILANLSSTVCNVISRIAKKQIISEENSGILGEYLHLFPTQTYLTTNYDQVVENLLKLRFNNVGKVIATKPFSGPSGLRVSSSNPSSNPTVYYLHGLFTERNVILSDVHYDDHYGSEGDIESSLRRDLVKKLCQLHNDFTFLYIGCSMTIEEDRILKLLREFYRRLKDFPFSYAFLNVATVTGEQITMDEWESLDVDKQKEIETKLEQKEDELENMNVRVIWYYATTIEERKLAQKTLFEYLLKEERQKWEYRRLEYIKAIAEKTKDEKSQSVSQAEWLQAFDNTSCGEDVENVKKSLRNKILAREIHPEKHAIAFPMYKVGGGIYQIYLISEKDKFYLSDEGTTYTELDKIFELKEPDVIKNLVAILKQYGCRKEQTAFVIDCTLEDIDIKISYLIQALSFMLNMKIFYV